MKYALRPARESDSTSILSIYNYFITKTWNVYREKPVSINYVTHLFEKTKIHPFYVVETNGKVIGWGLTKPYSTIENEPETAECSYFILPDYTGEGIGSKLLHTLIDKSRTVGIRVLLASIMAKNTQSISFHKHMGFTECGRFHKVIRKWGELVDLLWMEKTITTG